METNLCLNQETAAMKKKRNAKQKRQELWLWMKPPSVRFRIMRIRTIQQRNAQNAMIRWLTILLGDKIRNAHTAVRGYAVFTAGTCMKSIASGGQPTSHLGSIPRLARATTERVRYANTDNTSDIWRFAVYADDGVARKKNPNTDNA